MYEHSHFEQLKTQYAHKGWHDMHKHVYDLPPGLNPAFTSAYNEGRELAMDGMPCPLRASGLTTPETNVYVNEA